MKYDFRPYWNPVFIETGSGDGTGIKAALKCKFPIIYSIELSQEYFDRCHVKFAMRKRRVRLYKGDSKEVLPHLLSNINKRCTFWLDAHYCGGESGGNGGTAPLMEELKAIKDHHIKSHTILIDDIRLIRYKNLDKGWLNFTYSVEDLENFILKINPKYRITYDFGVVENDILVAQADEYDNDI
jgi:hypothetical protein